MKKKKLQFFSVVKSNNLRWSLSVTRLVFLGSYRIRESRSFRAVLLSRRISARDFRDTRYARCSPIPRKYIMVCTVVLSVVQDRHGYEVWISRSRHVAAVAALCLITIFVIFCHETDSGKLIPEIGPRSHSDRFLILNSQTFALILFGIRFVCLCDLQSIYSF